MPRRRGRRRIEDDNDIRERYEYIVAVRDAAPGMTWEQAAAHAYESSDTLRRWRKRFQAENRNKRPFPTANRRPNLKP